MKEIRKSDTLYIHTNGTQSSFELPIDGEVINIDAWLGGYNDKLFNITYISDSEVIEYRKWTFIAYANYDNIKDATKIEDGFEFLSVLEYEEGHTKRKFYLFHQIEQTKQEIREEKIDIIIQENE